jgi:hypothetical protein
VTTRALDSGPSGTTNGPEFTQAATSRGRWCQWLRVWSCPNDEVYVTDIPQCLGFSAENNGPPKASSGEKDDTVKGDDTVKCQGDKVKG